MLTGRLNKINNFLVLLKIINDVCGMEIIDKDFKEKIDKRISTLGVKKSHLANLMGLDAVRYSQTMSGKRKIQPNELNALKNYLGIQV